MQKTPTVITPIPCWDLTPEDEQIIAENGLDRIVYAFECATRDGQYRVEAARAAELAEAEREDLALRIAAFREAVGDAGHGHVFGGQFR